MCCISEGTGLVIAAVITALVSPGLAACCKKRKWLYRMLGNIFCCKNQTGENQRLDETVQSSDESLEVNLDDDNESGKDTVKD